VPCCLAQSVECTNRLKERRLAGGLCALCALRPHMPGVQTCRDCMEYKAERKGELKEKKRLDM